MSKKPAKTKSPVQKRSSDIIQIILKDHKPLWALIKTMKSKKLSYSEKKAAFEKFAPLLTSHAKPEEQTWYVQMKSEDDGVVDGLEGDVEHGLADQLCEELKSSPDRDMFMAKVKVLAELVEHHLEEEEDDLLPEFKKDSTAEERFKLGEKYLEIQDAFLQKSGNAASRAQPPSQTNSQRKPLVDLRHV